jgi:hypothetical protein
MGCKACERRRKALAEKCRKKQEQGKPVQAAALGAVLAVSEAAGKALGIHGEVEDEQGEDKDDSDHSPGSD